MSNFKKDPQIFKGLYGEDVLVYLEPRASKEMMGDSGLLGDYYWNGGSRSNVLFEGLEEAIETGVHEIEHGNYAHPEEEHRLKENSPGFSDSRNYRKLRRLFEYGFCKN